MRLPAQQAQQQAASQPDGHTRLDASLREVVL
jgi:hypothetical protein